MKKILEYNLNVIVDEVYIAFGISGESLYFKKMELKPDMVCLGKGISVCFPTGTVFI